MSENVRLLFLDILLPVLQFVKQNNFVLTESASIFTPHPTYQSHYEV